MVVCLCVSVCVCVRLAPPPPSPRSQSALPTPPLLPPLPYEALPVYPHTFTFSLADLPSDGFSASVSPPFCAIADLDCFVTFIFLSFPLLTCLFPRMLPPLPGSPSFCFFSCCVISYLCLPSVTPVRPTSHSFIIYHLRFLLLRSHLPPCFNQLFSLHICLLFLFAARALCCIEFL